jgi:threonine dehydratase
LAEETYYILCTNREINVVNWLKNSFEPDTAPNPMIASAPPEIAGVDGCKAGWIAVTFPPHDPSLAKVKVLASFAGLLDALCPNSVIAVDIPIGLPDRTANGGREPDWAARKILGTRQATVFPVPSRRAVYTYQYGYARVCDAARETSDPPRAPSIQVYWIMNRIQEVDRLLRRDAALRGRLFEVHPEVSFSLMNGVPIAEPKKVNGRIHAPGMYRRRQLLESRGFAASFLEAGVPRGAALDDFYDACACAWSATRVVNKEARVFPAQPGIDAIGLQVAIWA